MKKFFSIILITLILLALCACNLSNIKNIELPQLPVAEDQEGIAAPKDTDSTQEDIQLEAPTESSETIIVCFSETLIEHFDPQEGKTLILSFRYETPYVFMEEKCEISDKINSQLGLIDEAFYTGGDYGLGGSIGFNNMCSLAEDNFTYYAATDDETINLEFWANRSVSLGRADENIISLIYEDTFYTAAGERNLKSAYVFSSQSGELLRPADLFNDTNTLTSLISEKFDTEGIDSLAVEAFLEKNVWTLESEGLSIFYNVNETVLEAGAEELHIPYAEISGILPEEYLPKERAGKAEFKAYWISSFEEGSIPVIDKLEINDDGVELIIELRGEAYDVYVSNMYYSDGFYESGHIWYCNYMSDSAIQLKVILSEGMPNIKLSYSTFEGEEKEFFVTYSGYDGSIVLSDITIEAVG